MFNKKRFTEIEQRLLVLEKMCMEIGKSTRVKTKEMWLRDYIREDVNLVVEAILDHLGLDVEKLPDINPVMKLVKKPAKKGKNK